MQFSSNSELRILYSSSSIFLEKELFEEKEETKN